MKQELIGAFDFVLIFGGILADRPFAVLVGAAVAVLMVLKLTEEL